MSQSSLCLWKCLKTLTAASLIIKVNEITHTLDNKEITCHAAPHHLKGNEAYRNQESETSLNWRKSRFSWMIYENMWIQMNSELSLNLWSLFIVILGEDRWSVPPSPTLAGLRLCWWFLFCGLGSRHVFGFCVWRLTKRQLRLSFFIFGAADTTSRSPSGK